MPCRLLTSRSAVCGSGRVSSVCLNAAGSTARRRILNRAKNWSKMMFSIACCEQSDPYWALQFSKTADLMPGDRKTLWENASHFCYLTTNVLISTTLNVVTL